MTRPLRIQLSRKKGWRMPPNTVKVDRTTVWGNRWHYDYAGGAAYAVDCFRRWIAGEKVGAMKPPTAEFLEALRANLRGKNLACWCALPKPGEPDICHAAVLLEIANR